MDGEAQISGLKGFLRNAHISTLDLGASPVWKYMGTKLVIESDGHWNERGSAFAAAEIYRYLLSEGRANRLPLIGAQVR